MAKKKRKQPVIRLTKEEDAAITKAADAFLDFESVPECKSEAQLRQEEVIALRQRGEAALKQAEQASHRGDEAAAKRWLVIANGMSAEARRLLDLPPAPDVTAQDEEMRAELRRRIARFCEADAGMSEWMWRKEIWDEMAAEARRIGVSEPAPMPPRPPHWYDTLDPALRDKLDPTFRMHAPKIVVEK